MRTVRASLPTLLGGSLLALVCVCASADAQYHTHRPLFQRHRSTPLIQEHQVCPPPVIRGPGIPYPHYDPVQPFPGHPVPVQPKVEDPKKQDPDGKPKQPDPKPVDPNPQNNLDPQNNLNNQVNNDAMNNALAQADTTPISDQGAGSLPSSLGMLGRGDQTNRFNSFDNLNAIPRTQVWMGYQYLHDYRSTIRSAPEVFDTFPADVQAGLDRANDLTDSRYVSLYRFGAEVAFTDRFSVTFQHQYIASNGTDFPDDAWGNPQFLFKYACVLEQDRAISAIFGIQPEISTSVGELHETGTRFFLGGLFYKGFDNNRGFVQGGFQFGLINELPNTFDYGLSTGYFVYRHESLDPQMQYMDPYCDTCGGFQPAPMVCQPLLLGIVPQLELFGKHVISNRNEVPIDLGFDENSSLFQSIVSREDANAIDLTLGCRLLFRGGVSMGIGYSFPVTGGRVRDGEFLTTLNVGF